MRLEAALTVAARGVDVTLSVPDGTTLALLGPNGAGKSTVLEALAGMVAAEGRIALGDRLLLGGPRPVPSHRRRIGIVTQDSALLPSLTVRDNVGFGPRASGMTREASRTEADRWLTRVDATDLAARTVDSLSGGQARRVALARALAATPDLLLLDEPFAALDLEVATAMRSLVGSVLAERTAVLATHEVLDAFALAQDVAVLDSGRVVEHGPTERVLTRPRTAFAARMAGRSLLVGTWTGHALVTPEGDSVPASAGSEEKPREGEPAAIAPRPRELRLVSEPTPGAIPDRVRAVEPHGDGVRIHGERLATDVDPEQAVGLVPGARIHLAPAGDPPRAYAVT
ncbi:ABC transporter ATP-binding protein [Demequina zhanjiangensis]|uniref:ABC transporter ATP-binding protein n=1 Tax=Demequina zhanjiangensis TaxID=3051659 RepID=A0ABT8G043_9MICO|nr:ABC transporter ATP-binding protein [Demequina sp. SYSU T00b26]MDN4472472.1 ABC transporter ATP-binding protein [Demequina sp. SYSU T00b26]